MMHYYNYECPNCGETIEVEADVDFVDAPEKCEECGFELDQNKVTEEALESVFDRDIEIDRD
jgi:putative FmdB family regulatory protein